MGTTKNAQAKKTKEKEKIEHSKKLVDDVRSLLWVVTIGGLVLSACCIFLGYTGSLPWLTAMVGLPWTAHGAICACYLNLAKSDHSVGGITFESAKAKNFQQDIDNLITVLDEETICTDDDCIGE